MKAAHRIVIFGRPSLVLSSMLVAACSAPGSGTQTSVSGGSAGLPLGGAAGSLASGAAGQNSIGGSSGGQFTVSGASGSAGMNGGFSQGGSLGGGVGGLSGSAGAAGRSLGGSGAAGSAGGLAGAGTAGTAGMKSTGTVMFAAVAAIVERNCGAEQCHGGLKAPTLKSGPNLYTTLINTTVKECGAHKLVKPGDTVNSALIELPTWKCTDFVMPQGCADDPCLKSDDLTAISAWIQAGAPGP